MEITLFRCVYCRQLLCDVDLRISRTCMVCGQNKYAPAVKIEDDEMRAAIQRGYKYDDANFVYLDDALLKRGIVPEKKEWIIDGAAA